MSKKKRENAEPLILNRLAVVMKEDKLTNRKLAEKLQYDETTVSLWANNRLQPGIPTLARIALLMERDLREYLVDTTRFDEAKRTKYLAELSKIAVQSKRRGKNKAKSPSKPKKES